MDAWQQALYNQDAAPAVSSPSPISFVADPTGAVIRAWGLDWDLADYSAGVRSKRFSLFAVNGEVQAFNLMETPENAGTDAATLLEQIKSAS